MTTDNITLTPLSRDSSPARQAEIRILLVEDNPGDVNLINWMLNRKNPRDGAATNYSITTVDEFRLALEKLDTERYDVILLDLLLPDSQGMDTFTRMQAQAPLIPIIVLSGFDDEAMAVQAVREGAQDYLTKGHVDSNILKRSIHYAIERKLLEEERSWETSINAALTDLSEAIIISKSLEDISRLFSEQAKFFTGSTLCIAAHNDLSNDHINCSFSDDQPIDLNTMDESTVRLEPVDSIWQYLVRHNQPRLGNKPDFDHLATGTILDRYKIDRYLAVPALIGDFVAGYLFVANSPGDYTITDLRFIERLTALYALALQRQHSLEALKTSEERFRAVTQSANDAIITVDQDGRIISWNNGATAIFGHSELEIIQAKLTDLIPPAKDGDEVNLFRQSARAHSLSRSNRTIEASGYRKDGTEFPIELSAARWETGDGSFYTGIVRDISRRKRLEKQYRQAQKMEAVGQLAGGIAHDFNNILTGIIGFAELAIDSIEPGIPAVDYIRSIIRKSDHAATLVRQILAFSRKQILDLKQMDLNEAIQSVCNFIERVIGEHIDITTALAGDLQYIKADPTAVEQIITNLCVNARDAMHDGGQFVITTKNLNLSDEEALRLGDISPGQYCALSISDTGHGIDGETLQHIYEPFFTTKEVGQGSGLGLAMVYGLVKQHSGLITCNSTRHVGTTFQVLFPAIAVQQSHREEVIIDQIKGGDETVLMVEDEVDLIILTKSLLEQYGYTVLTAANGVDGYKVYQENKSRIKLIITDIVMPKEGGIELYKRVHADNAAVKFLFITGYASGLADKNMVIGEKVEILSKPYKNAQLAQRIRRILDF
ncbi:MAG: response regulator [Candidatus Neomarinimicrobiota bacterium]